MKKITKLISLFCLAAVFVLASCSSPTSGGNPGGGTGGGRAQVSGKIGKYDAPYVVGDIVFNDGSATPYEEIAARTTDPKITDAEKAAAIAVIFYVGTGLNSDVDGNPDYTISRTLGVGLKHSDSTLVLCLENSEGNEKISDIVCAPVKESGKFTFSGDKNGSDNFSKLGSDINVTGNYPAFEYAKNYGTNNNILTTYKDGWYLPSIAELYAIWEKREIVDSASFLFEGNKFENGDYWSSSHYECGATLAYYLQFYDGHPRELAPINNPRSACAIREF